MARRDREPTAIRDRREREEGDHPLPALTVAVHELDANAPARPDEPAQTLELGIVAIADRALPEAAITGTRTQCWSMNPIFSGGSSSRDGTTSGRVRVCRDCSAMRAARFADRTDVNVATARTRVPPAVASDAIVDQSAVPARYVGRESARCYRTLTSTSITGPTPIPKEARA